MTNNNADGLTVTVETAAKLLGLARASCYQAVSRGEIPSLRIGKRILIPRVALEKMLQNPPKK